CQCGQPMQADAQAAPAGNPAVAQGSASVEGAEPMSEAPFAGKVEQASAEEEITRLPAVDDEDATIVSDAYEPASVAPKRKGLIHSLFGK
ncbi:MAG TPA: hypothetical protein VGN42_15480, partial [Pirellulales bacterium]|nr:hypothetical protein [Pirellulales bacterium]